MHLRLRRRQLREDAPEAQRLFAERGPHPVVSGGRRVAFVEDEVDDFEHGREACFEFGPARHLEGDARLGEGALGADDALRDGRLRDEEGARDLAGRQPPEQAERERDARLGREHRVARDEDEAQEVVADVFVERGVEVRHGSLLRLQLAPEFLVLALKHLPPAQQVEGAVLGRGHEPGARLVGDA